MFRKYVLNGTGCILCRRSRTSSVSIYGIIDAGLTYIDNEAGITKRKLVDGANYGNRLGFRGSEDLGDG